MKMTRILGTLIAFAAISSAQQGMTNQTVEAMLRGGVAVPTILTAIKTAAYIQLFMSKEFYDRLLDAGASPSVADQIVQAMHDRTYKGAVRPEDINPAPAAVALARPPAVTTAVAQPVETPAPVITPRPAGVPAPTLFAPVHHAMTLEDGTPVRLRISRNLSSADAATGETVDFEVLEEIRIGDQVVIPKGTTAWGTVTDSEPKRRMGRGGTLNVTIDSVRLADGEKAALRGVKDGKGGGHVGAMTTGIVLTSLVAWPAAPLFLLMHGKDITIPKGTAITAYVHGDMNLDEARFPANAFSPTPSEPNATVFSKGTSPQAVPPDVSTPEPEFADVFFRLDGGNLVPLERQAVVTQFNVTGFLVVNGKGALAFPGAASPVRFRSGDLAFVVRSLSGASAADPSDLYRLRKLTPEKDKREAIISTVHASPLGASASNTRSDGVLPVRFSRYGASSYKVSVDALPPGEYALGQAGGHTAFCFGVD